MRGNKRFDLIPGGYLSFVKVLKEKYNKGEERRQKDRKMRQNSLLILTSFMTIAPRQVLRTRIWNTG